MDEAIRFADAVDHGLFGFETFVVSAYAAAGCTFHRMDCIVSGRSDFVQLVDAPDPATMCNVLTISGAGGGVDVDREVIELLDVESYDERRLRLPPTGYRPSAPSQSAA